MPKVMLLTKQCSYTEALGKAIQSSPKCGVDFEFEVVDNITDPDGLYIDVVDEVYERPWNIYCVDRNVEPREMCFHLINWCPHLYCIEFSQLKKIYSDKL
tara:strand:+ start:774 stop:1073 length:300 start_codon:yes stop_codon:yes gene_type:complete